MINFSAFNLATKASEEARQTDPAERCNYWSDLIDETADAYLEDLPVELFSYIAQYAGLDSVLNLRLVSRTTCHKVSDEKFRQRFHSLEVEVSRWSLQSFAQVTQKGSLGSTVKHVTIVGLAYDLRDLCRKASDRLYHAENTDLFSPEAWLNMDARMKQFQTDLDAVQWAQQNLQKLQRKGRDVELLCKAFYNIAAASPLGLESLSLDVGVYRDNVKNFARPTEASETPIGMILEAAHHAFQLTMTALGGSSLKMKSLDIYTDNKPCALGYGLPILDLDTVDWNALARSQALETLQRISINIFDDFPQQQVDYSDHRRFSGLQVDLPEDRSFSGLLLGSPNIQDLHISVCGTASDRWQSWSTTQHGRLWQQRIAQLMGFKPGRLEIVNFEGMTFKTKDLARFFKSNRNTIKSVNLQNIKVEERPFSVIAKLLVHDLPSLIDIRMQNITEIYRHRPYHSVRNRLSFHDILELERYADANRDQKWAPRSYSTDSESE